MRIEPCTRQTLDEWVVFRQCLWPDTSEREERSEAEAMLAHPERAIAFLARSPDGTAVGFAEATLRHDYVNGCTTSPVAFLEGIFVHPDHRKRGIARLLVQAIEDWAAGLGCLEFASDAELHNSVSHRMHATLGFEETERVVYFRKWLRT
jgi:aminoglycoside 6'-N-acetyltransferase I